ncbi:hypothetical protein Tmar_1870 [Thermaerobacter marianensis DSM 12885]|uniref:Uncharacterized protein n=1 Tax=Thermaerobacter marianensis (strain ATCC 700841 / DSM 12885 / JCM 10246 / 7p75a) TaxID=644966 RepID=E6SIF7_THEM7|nr:hypothetical protein [Thermaerobacter marianensis]ADU51968.1 hypothetical protein Tmar_1870 [Thermaerobacter marianensis DSM 12885]
MALAHDLLIINWRMLLTGQPDRVAKLLLVKQKRRRLFEEPRAVVGWKTVSQQLWPTNPRGQAADEKAADHWGPDFDHS